MSGMLNFREYKVGARLFAFALSGSMCITILWPMMDIRATAATEIALDKQLAAGWETGFNYDDPLLRAWNKPLRVTLDKDPASGAPLESAVVAYVYKAGTTFPSGIVHPQILGDKGAALSKEKGRIGEASKSAGAVFVIGMDGDVPYIENATATRGWAPDAILAAAGDANTEHVGAGKTIFVREGCWWCHTLLPEQTQDWQVFGAPPMLGDFNGESPTAFGSDRKAPDLLHVASRNSSKEWMMMHFFNPRLVQPHSIMPRFDYLWGEKDANGNAIDYAKWRAEYDEYREGKSVMAPEVPMYAANSDARSLIDFMLYLK